MPMLIWFAESAHINAPDKKWWLVSVVSGTVGEMVVNCFLMGLPPTSDYSVPQTWMLY